MMRLSKFNLVTLLMLLISRTNNADATYNPIQTNDDQADDANYQPRSLAIIGPDNRVDYAAHKNGLLFLQAPNWFAKNCTATLIHSEYAVTAKQCTSMHPDWIAGTRVHFNYVVNQPPFYTGNIASVYQSEVFGFALLRITPKADLGIMTTYNKDVARIKSANMAGYIFNNGAGVDYCCPVLGIQPQDGRVKHQCDGFDGAPLFAITKNKIRVNGQIKTIENYVLLGVQNGVISIDDNPLYNLAVPPKPIADLLKLVLAANVPDQSKPVAVWNYSPDPKACILTNGKPTRPPVAPPSKVLPTSTPLLSPTQTPSVNPTHTPSFQQSPAPTFEPTPTRTAKPTKKPARPPSRPSVPPTKKPVEPSTPPVPPPTKKPVEPSTPPVPPPTKKPVEPSTPPVPPPTKKPVEPSTPPVPPPTKKPVEPSTPPVPPPTKKPVEPSTPPVPPPTKKPVEPSTPPVPPPTKKPVEPSRPPVAPPSCKRRLTSGGHDGHDDCDEKPTKKPTPKPVNPPPVAPPSCRRNLHDGGGDDCDEKPTKKPTPKPVNPPPVAPPSCRRNLHDGGGDDCDGDKPTKKPTRKPVYVPPTKEPVKPPSCRRSLTGGGSGGDDCDDEDHGHGNGRRLRSLKM